MLAGRLKEKKRYRWKTENVGGVQEGSRSTLVFDGEFSSL